MLRHSDEDYIVATNIDLPKESTKQSQYGSDSVVLSISFNI